MAACTMGGGTGLWVSQGQAGRSWYSEWRPAAGSQLARTNFTTSPGYNTNQVGTNQLGTSQPTESTR